MNSIEVSTDSVFGVLYDHINPNVRADVIENINQICENTDSIKENHFQNTNVDSEKLIEFCGKNLNDRELFIEFLKLDSGNIEDLLTGNNRKYMFSLNERRKYTVISIAFIFILMPIFFLTQRDSYKALKKIGEILLETSLTLLVLYFLPKIIIYFMQPDTSFILKNPEESRNLTFNEILMLLVVIMDEIIQTKMLFYAECILIVSIVILLIVHFRKKPEEETKYL